MELLSQGDNWFIFHLLSAGDLSNVKKANAHFSDDLLSSLLNEPIPGQGVFWSSVGGKPYPVSVRVLSFERMYKVHDADYNKPAVDTFATELRRQFGRPAAPTPAPAVIPPGDLENNDDNSEVVDDSSAEPVDILVQIENAAIDALRNDQLLAKTKTEDGVSWGQIKHFFLKHLPETLDDRDQFAYDLVAKALNRIYGDQDVYWHSFRFTKPDGATVVRVKKGPKA
jgi:hypothetical protein